MRKEAQAIPRRSKGPRGSAQVSPVAQTDTGIVPVPRRHHPKTTPGTETLQPTTIVSNPPQAGAHTSGGYHSYSPEVKKMQDALLSIANELNIRHGKDNPRPELTDKLQNIAKHVEGQGQSYGDGLWGKNTQEALNATYDFINELTKHMTDAGKQKYTALLKQMEAAGVGPGKTFHDVKNVDASAKTLFDGIRTVIGNWNDDIATALTAAKNAPPPPASTPTSAPAPAVAPGAAPASSPTVETNQSTTTKVDYKPQGDAQQNTVQTGPAVGLSVYPFDTSGDIISMQQFHQFLAEVTSMQNVQEFQKSLGPYFDALNGQVTVATQAVNNWQQEARSNQSMDGFALPVSTDADALVNANFNHDFITARNMLGMLSELCSRMSYICEMLRRTKMFDDVALREQVQRGGEYIGRIHVIVSKIENQLRSGKTPGRM